MNEDFEIKEHPEISIPAIIFSVFAAIICGFILFVIFKSKSFQTYSFYYIIIFNIIFIIDNIFRIAPFDDKNTNEFNRMEKIQAISLVFLNKFEICIITMQNLTFYLGVIKIEKYSSNQKLIFFITFFISIFASLLIMIIFNAIGISFRAYSVYCYIRVTHETRIIDSVFHGIFYVASLFFLINLIIFLCKKRKEVNAGLIEDLGYNHYLCKVVILHFLNFSFFAISFLSNFLYLEFGGKKIYDILFLIIGFIIDLAYCFNRVLVKETLKIFCKDTHKQKLQVLQKMKILTNDDNYEESEDDDPKRQRTESF